VSFAIGGHSTEFKSLAHLSDWVRPQKKTGG
jgi:hypothetical protein